MQQSKRVAWAALGPLLTAAGFIIIFFVLSIAESRLKSPTSDEPPHIASGLSYVETGVFRGNPQHPPLLKELSGLSLILGGIRWPQDPTTRWFIHGRIPKGQQPEWEIGNHIISQNVDKVLFWARLPLILVACMGAAMLYLLGRELLGGTAALGALFLFSFDPTVLAHSFLVTTDVGVSAFTMLFLFALWNCLRAPSLKQVAFCGLALGAAMCAKFSAVLLLPIGLGLVLAARVWRVELRPGYKGTWFAPMTAAPIRPSPAAVAEKNSKRFDKAGRNDPCPCGSGKKYKACHGAEGASTAITPITRAPMFRKPIVISVCAFLAMCVAAFVVIQAVYFFPSDPLTYYRGLVLVNADHNPNYRTYFAGALMPRFPSYFAIAYLLKEPVAAIVLAMVGLIALIRTREVPRIAKLFLLMPPAVMFAAVAVGADNLGVRYIMPVILFAHLLGGFGIATLIRTRAKWALAATGVLCVWAIVAAAGIYPDDLSYLNETACLTRRPNEVGLDGGTRCGPLWLDDSNVDWDRASNN